MAADDGDPGPLEPEVDPGLQKRPRDLDLPPWLKGRFGTAVGRAVHGVLQTIDLATGDGLDDAVASQCQAEAVPDRAGDVRRLVQDALGSPSVRAAAGSAHWREVYACTPIGDRLLDWGGSYNGYYLCPSTYGDWVSTRAIAPGLIAFLQQVAQGDGATTTATTGTSGFRETAIVFSNEVKDNTKPIHIDTPAHFTCGPGTTGP